MFWFSELFTVSKCEKQCNVVCVIIFYFESSNHRRENLFVTSNAVSSGSTDSVCLMIRLL